MSKADEIVKKFKKPTAADKLYGNEEDKVINETAATNEESENNVSNPVPNPFSLDKPKKQPKQLKGIYLDKDVFDVYEEQAGERERGWGSQLVSDLLRDVFEKNGLLKRKK